VHGGGRPNPNAGSPRRPRRLPTTIREATPGGALDPDRSSHSVAPEGQRLSRVLVYECCPEREVSIQALLQQADYDLVPCESGEQLLEAVMAHKPDAVVYVFKPECQEDLGVLHLLRRLAPTVPLIVLANEGSLRLQRLVQEWRPIYYSVAPVEPAEIRLAVQAALTRRPVASDLRHATDRRKKAAGES
jgi:DNA-binding response OmpR family regulator